MNVASELGKVAADHVEPITVETAVKLGLFVASPDALRAIADNILFAYERRPLASTGSALC
jgi:hypothetical protein